MDGTSNDSDFSGGGRATHDLRLGHRAANDLCPPVRCEPWLGGPLELPCFALLQPSLKRGGAFGRLAAKQQSFHADTPIGLGPMNSITWVADLKIGALHPCDVGQTRKSANGNRHCATVFELDS